MRFAIHCAELALCALAALCAAALPSAAAGAASAIVSRNAGTLPDDGGRPFTVRRIATFDHPWAIAFLPDGRLLITEKPGKIFITTRDGAKTEVHGVPRVYYRGQNGLLDIAVSPRFAQDATVFFTYVAPEDNGGVLTLARARLAESGHQASLDDLRILWRQQPASRGGQPGGIIAFPPDGRHLFLSVGDRMEPDSAQNPDAARGKILRLNPDGSAPADNPLAGQPGVRALTWTSGHRNPYGLAFAPNGQLWETEMGPKGGDELNRIIRGKNYGWPIVSNGDQYDGTPIPRHSTHPEFETPRVYWTPVIAPAGLAFYQGPQFPAWQGSALIGGLVSHGLARIAFEPDGNARQADRWPLGARIRDVAVAPDGTVWVIEDGPNAALLRLVPRSQSNR
ncbi:PQQ-dependent sugar dehydrogenase [Castellaniella sp. MT123]|uniref:PQQ-dependent sugar dehydrogenase n=1 Tax=Castellaniella sp. MT123 TaxID=3140381 RepID=UPI0031F44F58